MTNESLYTKMKNQCEKGYRRELQQLSNSEGVIMAVDAYIKSLTKGVEKDYTVSCNGRIYPEIQISVNVRHVKVVERIVRDLTKLGLTISGRPNHTTKSLRWTLRDDSSLTVFLSAVLTTDARCRYILKETKTVTSKVPVYELVCDDKEVDSES